MSGFQPRNVLREPHGKASAPDGREEDAVSGKHSLPTAEGLPTHSFLPMCRNICKCGWPASATAAAIVVSAKKAFFERQLMPSTASRPPSGGRGRRRRCYLPGTSRAWIQPAPVGWGASCWLCEWTAAPVCEWRTRAAPARNSAPTSDPVCSSGLILLLTAAGVSSMSSSVSAARTVLIVYTWP